MGAGGITIPRMDQYPDRTVVEVQAPASATFEAIRDAAHRASTTCRAEFSRATESTPNLSNNPGWVRYQITFRRQ